MKLETKRLILRKPRISDWEDVVEGVGNIKISRMTKSIPHPYAKKDALKWINSTIKKWRGKEKKAYEFLIELKSEKKVIGCIGISKINKFVGTAMTGSWINNKYWKKGYISEAKIAANNFAFNKLKLKKLNSEVFAINKASNRTQQSMGYKFEGCKKKNSRSLATGKIHDGNQYGLFKEDWKKKLPKIRKRLNEKIKKLK